MRAPSSDRISRALIPLAIALPLALLGASLLPGGMTAALPWTGAPADPHGLPSRDVERPGNGSVSPASDRSAWQVSISPASATWVGGRSAQIAAVPSSELDGSLVQVLCYEWSLSNASLGSLSSDSENPTTFASAVVLSPTVETVSLTVIGWAPGSPLGPYVQASVSAPITLVAPLSLAPLQVSPDPVAPGAEVTLTTVISGGLPGYDATFDLGDGHSELVESSDSGTVRALHAYGIGVFSPTVNVTSADGESVSAGSASSVVVTAELAASIILPVGGDQGTPLTVEASVGGGSAPYIFSWGDSWGGSFYGGSSWTFVPARTGTLTFSLTVTDSAGGTATAPDGTVHVEPTPSLSVQSTSGSADVGTPLPLELSIQGGTGPFKVSWTPGESSPTLRTDLPSDGTYGEPYAFRSPGQVWTTATVTDALGATSDAGAMTGTIVPLPSVTLSSTPLLPTVGVPFSLTANVAGGISPYTWDWTFGAPVISGSPSAGTLPGPGSISWNGSLPTPESFTATLHLLDTSGGSVSDSLSFSVLSPLTVSLGAPQGRGEVGEPLVLTATVAGGQPGYLLSLTASDGEAFQLQLGQVGVADLSLVPRVPGNLTVDLEVKDQLDRSFLASTTIPVAPAFTVDLSLPVDPVDTGTSATAVVSLQGGWAPFTGTVTASNGQFFSFQGTNARVSISLGTQSPGDVLLRASARDALGSASTSERSLEVDPLPTVTVSAGSLQSDVGVPVPFLVSATGGTGAYPQAQVDFGDGNFSSTFSPTHTYARAGSYLVNATVIDSSGGRGSSAPVTLEIEAAPQAIASLASVGVDVGVGAAFSSEVEFGSAPYSYRWDFGDGTQSVEADPTHGFAAPGLYRVALEVQDASGENVAAPVLNVTVVPTASLSASVNRTSLEAGLGASFQAQVVGGAAPASVLWNFGDGTTLTGTYVNHSFQRAGTYSVEAFLRDAAGATASAALTLDVAPVLQMAPVAYPSAQAEVGVPLTLSEFPSGGVAPYQLSWQVGASQTSGNELTSWTLVPGGTGLLSGVVQVTDAAGVRCAVPFQVPVANTLSLNLTTVPSVPEAGLAFRLSSGSLGGVGGVSYTWDLPNGWPDPGNRSTFDATAPWAGSYPVSVQATDALGRIASATIVINVSPPLEVRLPAAPLEADAGVAAPLAAEVLGGSGSSIVRISTPFGVFPQGSGSLVFPSTGTYPVEFTAVDQAGAVAMSATNVTVEPAPTLNLLTSHEVVASAEAVLWSVQVLGGSGPTTVVWSVAGVGNWQGAEANVTLPAPGNYTYSVTVRDDAGGSQTRWGNATAVRDDLSLTLNASAIFGVAPFEPALLTTVSGSPVPVEAKVAIDSDASAAWIPIVSGSPWVLPLDLPVGLHVITVRAQDSLGASTSATIELTSLPPLEFPSMSPKDPVAQAGVPLTLTASDPAFNGTTLPGETVALRWWGVGLRNLANGEATFLSDHAGLQVVLLSASVSYPGAPDLENSTLPVVLRVVPAAPSALAVAEPALSVLAGDNASVAVRVTDPFGNPIPTFTGNLSYQPQGDPSVLPTTSPVVGGVAELELSRTKAGVVDYLVQAEDLGNASFSVRWTPDPSRALLQLLSWERVGTSLVVNISALDIYGNPLSNFTVSAQADGGPTSSGVAENGNLTLVLAGSAAANTIVLSGPDGAQTTVEIASPSDPPSGGELGWIAVVAFLCALLVSGVLLGRRHRRRRSRAAGDPPDFTGVSPSLLEAKGTLEDIIGHLPGEERDALLMLAEEHGIRRSEAEEALALLEKERLIERRTDAEGVDHFEPREHGGTPGKATEPDSSSSGVRP